MTVTNPRSRNDYVGSGTVGPFAYTFRVRNATDIAVTTRNTTTGLETTYSYPGDFTVSGVGNGSGGSVTMTQLVASGDTLTIRRAKPILQPTSLRNLGTYHASSHEDALDDGVMIDQQQEDTLGRSVRLPVSIDPAVFDATLPANLAPGDALVVNQAGTGFSPTTLSAAQLSVWSAAHNSVLDTFLSSAGFTPGVSTQLSLSAVPGNAANIAIIRRTSGANVAYMHDEFSVVGQTLTFTAPIPTGTTRVEVRYFYTYQVNTVDSGNATWNATGTGAISRSVRDRLRESISIADYGARADNDDNTAFIQDTADAIEAEGRSTMLVPSGRFILSHLDVGFSGLTIQGQGRNSQFKQLIGSTARYPEGDALIAVNLVDADSDDDVENNLRGFTMQDLLLEGNSVETGFNEIFALIGLQAVSEVLLERMKLIAPQGDGIAFYSGVLAAAEKHNEDLTMRKLRIDGVNYENRNGISIYDADGALIDDCSFRRLTKSSMPGAIDLEPRLADYGILRNVAVKKSNFKDIGVGGLKPGVIMYLFNTATCTTPRQNISVEGSGFMRCGGGVRMLAADAPAGTGSSSATTSPHNVIIRGNSFYDRKDDIVFQGLRKVLFEKNTDENSDFGIEVGTGSNRVYDFTSRDNTLKEIAQQKTGGYAYLLNLVDGFKSKDDTFINIGRADGTAGACIGFGGGGSLAARNIVTEDDNVVSSNARTKVFFEGAGSGPSTLDITTVRHKGRTTIDNNSGTGAAVFSALEARFGRTDDAGVHTLDSYALTSVPNDFPIGGTSFSHSTGTGPGGQTQGVIETLIFPRQTGVSFAGSYQRYASIGYAPDTYYTRQSSADGTGWTSWTFHPGFAAPATAITTPTAPSGGYVQAEAVSAKAAIDNIRLALIAAKITA
jgi:hypothetical protein